MYADDTQIYYHFKLNKLKEVIGNANKDLNNISKYSERNCLNINAGKSKYIIIGSPLNVREMKKETLDPIQIGRKLIERETEAVNLGLT